MDASNPIFAILLRWGLNTLALWAASYLLPGITFADIGSLLISGLVLGFVNAFVKPLFVILTFPITVVTLGLFLLVANTLMLLLVAWLVQGFSIASFWSGFIAAIFISIFSFFTNRLIGK